MADDVRTTCERCRRPTASDKDSREAFATGYRSDLCYRPDLRAKCDRLLLAERDALLERAREAEQLLSVRDEAVRVLAADVVEAEAERDALRTQVVEDSAAAEALYVALVKAERERDALVEAGDALAAHATELLPGGTWARWRDAEAAWRALRSPKGASNGD